MPYAPSAKSRIYYETFGGSDGMPLVLIEGGFTQMVGWAPEFIEQLTEAGFLVVAFDNRDSGLSTHFGGPDDLDGGYGIEDLADDVTAVLDHAAIASAHVAGRSMGGMIAQMLAIRSPERVRSLGLFYSIPGRDKRYILHGDREELDSPQRRFPLGELLENALAAHRAFMPHGDAWGESRWYEDETRRYITRAYERRYSPDGAPRQWRALKRAPERLERLKAVDVPTAVIHGRADHVLHWCAAVDIAAAMPASELHVYPGMGHFFPPALIPDFVRILLRTARQAERRPGHARHSASSAGR
ncbi:pimeloyl-ACP methyl ester carboxylesterase [Murinocardiopsis flavida]|uniref:Pimeloyl-ACP methyl ester carboxylesterase n=1 Tax=Murinocardiopsis flavida TaxID=645275 RepID=A0A2P8DSX2_9ACTN|nr:alpha/beta hydrolase [Murinocardiopsis flavida]PSL00319.1 pimeloyl-ACP methyl ester carboxylesterase [Murinocardiopsis flavida]